MKLYVTLNNMEETPKNNEITIEDGSSVGVIIQQNHSGDNICNITF